MLAGRREGEFHGIGKMLPQVDKGTASWYVVRAVPCFWVSRPSSLPALAWIAAGELAADEFSMSTDADTCGNGYVADKLRMMMTGREQHPICENPTSAIQQSSKVPL